jgi:hypothetical protein
MVFDTDSGSVKGKFEETHVKGILFRIVTYPDIVETFKIFAIYSIGYAGPLIRLFIIHDTLSINKCF